MSNFTDFIGGGGGGGTEIDGLVGGLTGKSIYTTASGEVYLQTGITLTDVASYPDAQQNIGITVDPTPVSIPSGTYGLATDGVLGFGMSTSKQLLIYNVTDATGAWTYTTYSTLGAEYNMCTSATLIPNLDMAVVDNGGSRDLYVLGDGGTATAGVVIKHTGVTSSSIGTASTITLPSFCSIPRGLTWDGTHFWVFSWNTNSVHKLTSAFVDTGESHYIGQGYCKLEYDSVASTVWAFAANNTNMVVAGTALATGSRMWPLKMGINQPTRGMIFHATTNTMGLVESSGTINPVDMTEKTIGHPYAVLDSSNARNPQYENWLTYYKRIK